MRQSVEICYYNKIIVFMNSFINTSNYGYMVSVSIGVHMHPHTI